MDHISPLIENGHSDFGENKVQEAINKWTEIKNKNKNIKLHMVGKLQTNKVKFVLPLFDFIHSLDNLKLAKKISEVQKKYDKKPKIFIQVNIGNESQKSGIIKSQLTEFYNECLNLGLDIVGTMCLPPLEKDPNIYFSEMKKITSILNLNDISMGMSEDYDLTIQRLEKKEPWLAEHYKNDFNNFNTRSLQEIFNEPAWKEITDAWTTRKRELNRCWKSCADARWKVSNTVDYFI